MGARDDVSEALGRAVGTAGSEVLQQPRRLRAVLADLVGQPASDHRAEIEAVVAAAEALAGEAEQGDPAVLAALRRRGIDDSTARWALSVLREHGVGVEDTRVRVGGRSRRWLQISAICLVVAVPLLVLLIPRPSPDPDDDGGGSSTTTASSTPSDTSSTSTSGSSEGAGFRVEFESSTEGDFEVSRTWEISDGRLTGTVSLTAAAGAGPAQHRELVPAEAFGDPVFTPGADNQTGDVAVFNLDQSDGEGFSITFEADLTVPEPDEAAVQSWIDLWRDRVVDLRPLDSAPAANASITPLP